MVNGGLILLEKFDELSRESYVDFKNRSTEVLVNKLLKNLGHIPEPEWIDVNDRLPEDNDGEVLASVNHCGEINYFVLEYVGNDEWLDWQTRIMPGVTHWMPLPKPPKK